MRRADRLLTEWVVFRMFRGRMGSSLQAQLQQELKLHGRG